MKRNFTFIKTLSLGLFLGSGATLSAQVCVPEPLVCRWGDMITNVEIGDLANPSKCSVDGYTDYTDTLTPFELTIGQANDISVTVADGFENETVMVWIDYNNNDKFEENEYYYFGTAAFAVTGEGAEKKITKSITLPESVEEGKYRMRVRVLDGVDHDPGYSCNVYFMDDDDQVEVRWPFGEIEDYWVNVTNNTEVTYCAPEMIMCEDDDQIHRIKFLGIDNESTCDLVTGHSDFTSLKQEVGPGQTFDITATIGSGWKYESLGLWIDYNQDNQFTEDEFTLIGSVMYPSTTNNGIKTDLKKSITIPETALLGETLMRFRIRATGSDQPDIDWEAICEDEDFGEIEDYTLKISTLGVSDLDQKSNVKIVKKGSEHFVLSSELMSKIQLFAMNGQQLQTLNGLTKEVNLSSLNLKRGVYVLKIEMKDGKIITRKVIL